MKSIKNEKTPATGVTSLARRHPIITTLLAIAVAAVIVAWLLMAFLGVWTHHGDDTTVPDVRHQPYSQAATALEAAGLSIEISDSLYDRTFPPGTVMEIWPRAGSQVKNGRTVYATVTAFSPKNVTLTMPVTGVSSRQAMSYLTALGISGIRIVHVPSEYPDLVESAYSAGRPLGVGSTLPVDASVELHVGVAQVEEEPVDSATQAVIDDFMSDNQSQYYE